MTGLWVFYTTDDDQVTQKKIIGGKTAYLDPRYARRSFAEGKLVEVMLRCWEYEPEDRIDIFEVVDILRKAVEENKRLGEK